MTNELKKEIKILDADTSILELLQHITVNFLYGFTSGLVIMMMVTNQPFFIFISYYTLKQIESKVLNRNKYTTRLGKNYIYPIPSTIGFLLSYFLANIINSQ